MPGIVLLIVKDSAAHSSIDHEMNGNIVPDPDMELEVDLEMGTVDAKTFQNVCSYSEVKEEDVLMQKELNDFLDMWFTNLIDQSHK